MPQAPGALPLLGHIPQLIRDPLNFLESLPQHGDLLRVRLGPASAVVVCDPQLTRQVLRDDRTFDKGGLLIDRAQEVLGIGLATCSHREHRRQRRLVQPAFHSQRLRSYTPAITAQITTVTESWRDGQHLDVFAEMTTIAARAVAAALFSGSISESDICRTLDDLTTIDAGIYRRMLVPPLLNRVPSPANRHYHRARARLRRTFGGIIADRRASGTDFGDLLSALLAAHDTQGHGHGLSDTEIVDTILALFLAGTESTASTLAYALHLLASHPDIAEQLRAEVDAVLINGRPSGSDDVPRLELTGRVITETLRLWPPAWIATRYTTTDTRLGGYPLSPGTTVIYSPYILHHRKDDYPDPGTFDPDRWLPGHHPSHRPSALIPFSDGARKCIGDRFALIEATLALATIVGNWHLEPLTGHNAHPTLGVVLTPRQLRLRATRREGRSPAREPK
nr:cytochrome P450 [Nocardia brasiliensis]